MKLSAEPVFLADDHRKVAAIRNGGDRRRARIAGVAVRKIKIVAAAHPEIGCEHVDLAPAHVRDRAARSGLHLPHSSLDQPQAGHVTFVATFEQQLHPKTDAERWLPQRPQSFAKLEAIDPFHCLASRSDSGENDSLGQCKLLRI